MVLWSLFKGVLLFVITYEYNRTSEDLSDNVYVHSLRDNFGSFLTDIAL